MVASLRSTIPLIGDDEPGRSAPGYELAFNLAVKLPIPIGDIDAIGTLPHGRPLRCGDQHILPELFIDGVPTQASELPDSGAQRYAQDARAEHASVPAFLRLASELARHGAHALAQRAVHAAHEEVSHARICLDIARSRSRTRLALGRISLPARPLPSLEALAIESAVDGFVAEGRAAAEVRRKAERERDSLVRCALQRIARDEQGHADLARDVVRHCVARSGPSARCAVTRALEAQGFSARALLD